MGFQNSARAGWLSLVTPHPRVTVAPALKVNMWNHLWLCSVFLFLLEDGLFRPTWLDPPCRTCSSVILRHNTLLFRPCWNSLPCFRGKLEQNIISYIRQCEMLSWAAWQAKSSFAKLALNIY